MKYHTPRTLSEALKILSGGEAGIIAGCTDSFVTGSPAAGRRDLLDLTGIGALNGIARTEAGWRIGATTRWSQITAATLPPAFDALKEAGREVGSVQIQNAGTIAGNICNASPAADGVPPLLCLNAEVELTSVRGTRQLALDAFITGPRQTALAPDELVSAILIPHPPERARAGFEKLGSRRYLVISIAMVSAMVTADDAGQITDARIAIGACSPVAMRLHELEKALTGQDIAHPAIPTGSFDALSPIDDVRANAAYRRDAAAELCRRIIPRLQPAGKRAA